MNLTAPIAATVNRPGVARDNAVGAAMPAVSRGSKGSSAPAAKLLGLLAISLVALFSTAAPASADTAEMLSITNPSYNSATVKGKASFDGSPTFHNYRFEYAISESGPWTTGPETLFIGAGLKEAEEEHFKVPKGGTHYFVRLALSFGTITSPPLSFTTLPVDPPSVLATANASEVRYTTAKASGEIERPANPDPAFDANCRFEYVTDAKFDLNGYAEAAPPVPCGIDSLTVPNAKKQVEVQLEGLAPATEYHLRLTATNAGPDASLEAASTFTTQGPVPAPSVIKTEDATEVEYSRATVKGEVSRPPGADPILNTECHFEYITDTDYQANPVGERFTGAGSIPCEGENPITATAPPGATPVEAHLNGLAPAATYHLRLSATNAGGQASKEAASTFTTLGPVTKPLIIETGEATAIGKRSAHVSGTVERPAGVDPAFDVECNFEYITDAQFTANPPGEEFAGATPVGCETITSPDGNAVTAEVEADLGLEPGTTYHLRLSAKNAGGTVTEDAPSTFTTIAIVHPSLTLDPVTEVGYTNAHITGTVDPGNQGVRWAPQYAIDPGTEGWTGNLNEGNIYDLGPGTGPTPVAADLPTQSAFGPRPPLKPGTTYQVRIVGRDAEEGIERYSESPREFTTKGTNTPPSTTLQVTDVTGTTAHVSGTVDTHAPAGPLPDEAKAAYKTDWHFECTPVCPPGLNGGTVSAAEGSQSIEIDAKNLEAKTPYEIKLVAHNSLETVESEQAFETLFIPPTVTALPDGPDGEGGYTLAGIVNPNNSPVTTCEFKWGPDSNYVFKADCSPPPGEKGKPVTVEAHLTGLNPGSVYHADLVATNAAGTEDSKDFTFKPTLAVKGPPCPNEQLREENDSLGLPECRAYELVSYPNKEGRSAAFQDFSGGDAVAYKSEAANLVNSGQGGLNNAYVATRTATGWQTIPDLNGPSGSIFGAPEEIDDIQELPYVYSSNLLSSIWSLTNMDTPALPGYHAMGAPYLRRPDGRFVLVGRGSVVNTGATQADAILASDDLSHVVLSSPQEFVTFWGPGVYEFVGTGNDQPRRVDVDNSEAPICPSAPGETLPPLDNTTGTRAHANAISTDGRVIVFSAVCDGSVQARVDATTTYDVSASQCNRMAPAEPCNAPAAATYQGAAKDGSRVYFTTTQQLVDGDTDQTNDLYACDLPTTPQAPVGNANPCSALHEVSAGSDGNAQVQQVLTVSDDGSTAYFTAKGILADNEDALGEEAVQGDENLYVWRTDAAHPDGQTAFVGKLTGGGSAQTTPNGRYLVLQTAGQLLASDTDESIDVYRYDADTGELVRVSTAVSGVGGNGEFDASIVSGRSISNNGEMIVFSTKEALSPLDGNGEPDAYLWNDGHALGSVAPLLPGVTGGQKTIGKVSIDGSGQDIYLETAARLNPSDVDFNSDVYDARINGGFPQHEEGCVGETCQPPVSISPSSTISPANHPDGEGNLKPKTCPKGKVLKGKNCVKKHQKKHKAKHHKKKNHKKHSGQKQKRTGSNNGGGK